MTNILMHKGKTGVSYYAYDYVLKGGKRTRIYVGKATEEDYKRYRDHRPERPTFCLKCGLRRKDTASFELGTEKYCSCRKGGR